MQNYDRMSTSRACAVASRLSTRHPSVPTCSNEKILFTILHRESEVDLICKPSTKGACHMHVTSCAYIVRTGAYQVATSFFGVSGTNFSFYRVQLYFYFLFVLQICFGIDTPIPLVKDVHVKSPCRAVRAKSGILRRSREVKTFFMTDLLNFCPIRLVWSRFRSSEVRPQLRKSLEKENTLP